MSGRGFSWGRLALLLVSMLVVGGGAVIGIWGKEIQRGLKFPGKVGTAADEFFFSGEPTSADFRYWQLKLGDGSEWKVIEADTENQPSLPTWLIYMVQGPDRQTLILEERFDAVRMSDLNRSLSTLTLEPDDLEIAQQTAPTLVAEGSPYLALIQTTDAATFTAALEGLGFRKTSF